MELDVGATASFLLVCAAHTCSAVIESRATRPQLYKKLETWSDTHAQPIHQALFNVGGGESRCCKLAKQITRDTKAMALMGKDFSSWAKGLSAKNWTDNKIIWRSTFINPRTSPSPNWFSEEVPPPGQKSEVAQVSKKANSKITPPMKEGARGDWEPGPVRPESRGKGVRVLGPSAGKGRRGQIAKIPDAAARLPLLLTPGQNLATAAEPPAFAAYVVAPQSSADAPPTRGGGCAARAALRENTAHCGCGTGGAVREGGDCGRGTGGAVRLWERGETPRHLWCAVVGSVGNDYVSNDCARTPRSTQRPRWTRPPSLIGGERAVVTCDVVTGSRAILPFVGSNRHRSPQRTAPLFHITSPFPTSTKPKYFLKMWEQLHLGIIMISGAKSSAMSSTSRLDFYLVVSGAPKPIST